MKRSPDMISVAEKRELSKLLEKQYEEAIQQAVTIEQELCEKAETFAMRKLGVDLIIEEMEKLEKQKELLISRIQELGFDYNYGKPHISKTWDPETNNSIWKRHTQAGKEAMKILEGSTNLSDLKAEKVSVLKKLWLATTRDEVFNIVGNGKVEVKLKEVKVPPQLVASNK